MSEGSIASRPIILLQLEKLYSNLLNPVFGSQRDILHNQPSLRRYFWTVIQEFLFLKYKRTSALEFFLQ